MFGSIARHSGRLAFFAGRIRATGARRIDRPRREALVHLHRRGGIWPQKIQTAAKRQPKQPASGQRPPPGHHARRPPPAPPDPTPARDVPPARGWPGSWREHCWVPSPTKRPTAAVPFGSPSAPAIASLTSCSATSPTPGSPYLPAGLVQVPVAQRAPPQRPDHLAPLPGSARHRGPAPDARRAGPMALTGVKGTGRWPAARPIQGRRPGPARRLRRDCRSRSPRRQAPRPGSTNGGHPDESTIHRHHR